MELSFLQYHIVYNLFSLTVAVMFAAGIYFLATANRIAERYRPAMYVSALIVFVAGYHYFRIFGSWEAAFAFQGSGGMDRAGTYVPAPDSSPFNEAYRYADWLLTVPLLIVELYIVTKARDASQRARTSMTALIVATLAMLIFGYIGETQAQDALASRALWGTLSTIPFLYIVYKLFTDVQKARAYLPGKAAILARNTSLLLLLSWGFYPIVYCFPFLGFTGTSAEIAVQSGYTIADITAKAGYGLLIHHIARERTVHEGGNVATATTAGDARPARAGDRERGSSPTASTTPSQT